MKKILVFLLLVLSLNVQAVTYYLSPTGLDSGTGAIGSPWFTLTRAWQSVAAGDIIYMRGGTYLYNDPQNLSGKSGTAGNLIKIWSYSTETPVITRGPSYDMSRGELIYCTGNYLHWKGLTIAYFDQRAGEHAYSAFAFYNVNNCIFENLKYHHNGSAMWIRYTSTGNLVKNSDFHHNNDPYSTSPYAGADGLNITYISSDKSNTVTGCRFWRNSDDGLDIWGNSGYVKIDSCWTWQNGYRLDGTTQGGDGVGIKTGELTTTMTGVLRRLVTNCWAAYNRTEGITENDVFRGIIHMYNNTAYHNVYGFRSNLATWGQDNAHIFRNNLAYDNSVTNYSFQGVNPIIDHNSWQNGLVLSAADFKTGGLDSTGISGARQSNGNLPMLNFLKLASTSDLVNAGVIIAGMAYESTAPDLGAYEYVPDVPAILPSIITNQVSNIGITYVTGNGNVTSDGGGIIEDKGICWSTSANPTIADSKFQVAGTAVGTFSGLITPLTPGETYHYRAFVKGTPDTGGENNDGYVYGSDLYFTTPIWQIIMVRATSIPPLVYYVSNSSGNDSNTGRSIEQAWQTLAYAETNATIAGGIIALKKGDTWTMDNVLNINTGGSVGRPIIWDGGYWGTGANAIIRENVDGGAAPVYYASIHIAGCNYVTMKNITLDVNNKNRRGIVIGGADDTFGATDQNNESYITIQDCEVKNVGSTDYYCTGIDVQPWNNNISYITIQGNTIDSVNNQGIAFYPGRTDAGAPANNAIINSYIGYNTITNCGMGLTSVGAHISIGQDCRNTICEHNTIVSSTVGNIPGIALSSHLGYHPTGIIIRYNDVRMSTGNALAVIQGEAQTADIYYNKFYGNSSTINTVQIWLTDGELYTGCHFNIYNNTIISATKVAFSDNSNIASAINFKNNLLIGNENTNDYAGNPGHTSLDGSMVHTNNAYWRLKTGTSATLFVHGATYVPRNGLLAYEATAVITNPLLTNEAGFDWTLQAGSPCINTGVDVGLTTDYAGNPMNGLPDIGCYERQ